MGMISLLFLMGNHFSFLLTLDSHCVIFFLNFSFFFPSSQRQTMQEAPGSLFLVKDQLLSRIAPSKPSCLGKLQSTLLDRPRLPKLPQRGLFGSVVTRAEPPAFHRNSNSRLGFPGPTQERPEIPVVFENPDATREKRRGSNVFTG